MIFVDFQTLLSRRTGFGAACSHFHLSFQLLLRGDYRSRFQYDELRLELVDHAQALVPINQAIQLRQAVMALPAVLCGLANRP